MKKFLFAMVLFSSLVACTPGPFWMHWMYKGPPEAKDGPPYPELYIRGWQDGCETGTAAVSNHYYKFFHSWKQDATLARNKVYYQGWQDSYSYCSRYLQQYFSKPFL